MSGTKAAESSYDVVCPHCKKAFTAELIEGEAERYRGFKCPHCKLFIPYERADEQDLLERADSAWRRGGGLARFRP